MKRCKTLATLALAFCLPLFFAVAIVASATGCASLKEKDVAAGSQFNGAKIETVGTSSGTPMPNAIFGSAQISIVTSLPHSDTEKVVPKAHVNYRTSFLGSLFGAQSNDFTISYVGSTDETGEHVGRAMTGIAKAISAATGHNISDSEPVATPAVQTPETPLQ